MPFLSGYTLRKKWTQKHTAIGSTLTNFPCVIVIAADSVIGANIDSNGYNFRITSSDGTTTLPYERKNFVNPGGSCTVQLYFKAPSLSSSVDTDFYLYYKSPSPSDGADPTNVWDANFLSVFHLDEDPAGGAGCMKDSTSHANNGTPFNGPTQVSGPFGNALQFDGINDYFDASDSGFPIGTNARTFECLVNPTALPGSGNLAFASYGQPGNATGSSTYRQIIPVFNASGEFGVSAYGAGNINGGTANSTGTWAHFGFTMPGGSNSGIVYRNGANDGSGGFGSSPNTVLNGHLVLGARWDGDSSQLEFNNIKGKELRISNVARSADWLAATYTNLLDYSNFATLGTQETSAGIAFDAVSNSGYQAASASYSWSHTNAGNFLAVDVSLLSVPGTTVTAITYNGLSLTKIGSQYTGTAIGGVECWGLANPPVGTFTIAVTLSASIISSGEAVSYSGVDTVVPTESFNGAFATNVGAADATVTVTPITDATWIHGAIATTDSSITANQTSRNNVTGAGGSGANEDSGAAISPATGTATSYTGVGALMTWAIAGYALRPTQPFDYIPWDLVHSPQHQAMMAM